MNNIPVLRKFKENSIFIILISIYKHPNPTLKVIAEETGITVQAVSLYIKKLEKIKYIEKSKNGISITINGIQFIHEHYKEISQYLKSVESTLNVVNTCTSIAGEDIFKNDIVYTFMEKGLITGYKSKKSSSWGVAKNDAKKGELLILEDPKGILELYYGSIFIVKSSYLTKELFYSLHSKYNINLISIEGLEAYMFCKKLNVKPDIMYGSGYGSVEAAMKGLNVLYIISDTDFSSAINNLNNLLEKYRDVRYKIYDGL